MGIVLDNDFLGSRGFYLLSLYCFLGMIGIFCIVFALCTSIASYSTTDGYISLFGVTSHTIKLKPTSLLLIIHRISACVKHLSQSHCNITPRIFTCIKIICDLCTKLQHIASFCASALVMLEISPKKAILRILYYDKMEVIW